MVKNARAAGLAAIALALLLATACTGPPESKAGTRRGSVVAWDAASGRPLWQTGIGDVVGVAAIGVNGDTLHLFALTPMGLCSGDLNHLQFDARTGGQAGPAVPLAPEHRAALSKVTHGILPSHEGDLLIAEGGLSYRLESRDGTPVVRAYRDGGRSRAWEQPLPDPDRALLGPTGTYVRATVADGILSVATATGDDCGHGPPPGLWKWLPIPVTLFTAVAASCAYLVLVSSENPPGRRALLVGGGVAAAAVSAGPFLVWADRTRDDTVPLMYEAFRGVSEGLGAGGSPVGIWVAVAIALTVWFTALWLLVRASGVPPASAAIAPLAVVGLIVPAFFVEAPLARRALENWREGDTFLLQVHTIVAVVLPIAVFGVAVAASWMTRSRGTPDTPTDPHLSRAGTTRS